MFLIFDIEIVLLVPWAINSYSLGFFGLLLVFAFSMILTLGFIYEWFKGALTIK